MGISQYPDLTLRIGGQQLALGERASQPVINPSDETVLGRLPHASAADVDAALEAASSAFEGWRGTVALDRSALLRRVAGIIRRDRATLAALIASELGKPIDLAMQETETAAEMFEWSAEESRRSYGRIIPARAPHLRFTSVLEPVGPVAAFAGWNAPSITPSRKIAGAIAAGCSVVIKPSEATPATALFIADALDEAGAPPGLVNVLFGDPGVIAGQLMDSTSIRMVTFTGGVDVGKQLAALAAGTMKRTVFELGGHAPVIVMPDVDAPAVARAGAAAAFRNSGQVCTSPTRFLVHRSIRDEFTDAFVSATRELVVGDPFTQDVSVGPLQNERRLRAIEGLIEDAVGRGATLATGGRRIDRSGYFFEPTVVLDADASTRVAREEPFGPLKLINSFDELDHALTEANRLAVGLASYAFTHDVAAADRIATSMAAGNVVLNHWAVSFAETPFGGVGDSGVGTEGGIEGLRAFQQIKFISTHVG